LAYHPGVRFPKNTKLAHRADYADSERVFHLVFRTHPEISALAPAVAGAIWRSVMEQRSGKRIKVHAACLMPDHLHLLISPAGQDILTFEQRWKSWTSKLARDAGHFGPVWQPGMWDRVCRNEADFESVHAYILTNPVAAGLVTEEGEWPWVWSARWAGEAPDRATE
jgi:REP element-mobilizing transposase RayT